MGLWSLLLLAVGILWLAQIAGTYYQIRHYRKVLSRITQEGGEGYVGAGNAKARFGKGVILILVVGEDERVKRALKMRGATVFARFEEDPDLSGLSIDELRDEKWGEGREKGVALAARRAVEQIDRIKKEKVGTL
ncbi:MAG TPA: transcriptional regulator GutM [Rubrobacteraceae bacterium]|jgi:glucitol operon activator protein|nr:transcriptional regulator GutM [Rubrobacteraceae bacterium]